MKRYSTWCFFYFLLCTQISAQVIYERTYTFASNSIEFPLELSDTSTFSFDHHSNCNAIQARHIDKYGNEIADNGFGAEGFSSGYHWIGHDSVLIWVEHGAYDVGPDSLVVFLWTPEQTQKLLSSSVFYDFSPNRKYGAFLYNPERIVFEKTDTLYVYNLLTESIEDSLILQGIYTIKEFDNAILVMSDDDDPLVLNDHLEEIAEWNPNWTLPFPLEDALVLDSFLVGLDPLLPLSVSAVNVYNESVQDIDLSTILDQLEDIQVNQYWLFVKGKSNGEEVIIQMDGNLQIVDVKILELPIVNKEFSYRYYPDRVYAWSTDGISDYKANYRICYPYTDPNPIEYVDIALDTIWVDSVSSPHPHDEIIFLYLKAVVSNRSQNTVQSFTMHHEEVFEHYCFDGVYLHAYDQRNIEPGESDTIRFQLWSYTVMSFQRRVFVHHANHHLDSVMANNSFLVNHLISSAEEPVRASLNVYPNPFTDFLQIADVTESSQLILYDQTGRLVSSGYGQLNNLGYLPTGMYVLQVVNGQTISVNRVLKVE